MKKIFLTTLTITLIISCGNSNSKSKDKCEDMNSYNGGINASRENGNMIADCSYYWDDLLAKQSYESKSCFCKGFNSVN